MLAERGYTALAIDMYGDGKQAHHPDDAGKFASEVAKNTELAKARFDSAYSLISKEKTVDSNRIAAIGYCFGGSVVLDMARIGEPLKAVMISTVVWEQNIQQRLARSRHESRPSPVKTTR